MTGIYIWLALLTLLVLIGGYAVVSKLNDKADLYHEHGLTRVVPRQPHPLDELVALRAKVEDARRLLTIRDEHLELYHDIPNTKIEHDLEVRRAEKKLRELKEMDK